MWLARNYLCDMPIVPFETLPDSARIWVFASDRPLLGATADTLLAAVDQFLADWSPAPLRAGVAGQPLSSDRRRRHGGKRIRLFDRRSFPHVAAARANDRLAARRWRARLLSHQVRYRDRDARGVHQPGAERRRGSRDTGVRHHGDGCGELANEVRAAGGEELDGAVLLGRRTTGAGAVSMLTARCEQELPDPSRQDTSARLA